MDSNSILNVAGDFGRYQFLLMSLFCAINMLSSAHYYSQTIISITPEHWCKSHEIDKFKNDDGIYNMTNVRNYLEILSDKSCTKSVQLNNSVYYNVSGNEVNTSSENGGNDEASAYIVIPCNEGWSYNYDYGYKSMVSELNWVCDDTWKSTIGQSFFFVGSVVGTLIFGFLADVVGRLPVLILANLMALFGNGATVMATDVVSFSVCRFVSGIATDSNFVMMYILVMEYLSPERRTLGLNLCIGLFYCIGSACVPWIAVLLGDWQTFLVATTVPIAIVPVYYFLVPESAQWLLSKGRLDDAVACYKQIASFNHRTLTPEVIDAFRTTYHQGVADRGEVGNPVRSSSVLGLIKTPRLRRITIILLFKSMVLTLCYDAISRNVNGLGFSPFIVFSLSAATILPACGVLLALQDRIGRKAMAAGALLLTGIFTAASGALLAVSDNSDRYLTAGLAVFGRFWVTIAFNSGTQYAAELIPTEVRGQGVSTVHVAGYAATFFSSYVLYSAKFYRACPSMVLGFLSILCGVSCLFLPETLGRPLPTTLADGEEFGRGEGILEFAFLKRKDEQKTKQNGFPDL